MTEELISFMTAQSAKAKGFNEPGVYFFQQDMDPLVTTIHTDEGNLLNGINTWNDEDFNGQIKWARPTQSLLQRWLREKHDIHIAINRESLDSDEMCYVHEVTHLPESHGKHWVNDLVIYRSFGGIGTSYYGGWNTYEETLENALQYSLNLIPTT